MYLKRIEMLGFKSFAARTQLEFSPGVTAVVGPNGAGKSNVADAMRWVLGEQSMRQLRGKKSDDIIFVGGHGRAPLGMAEVTLTLDNSTGWVPSEYSEISVTRRSYRSGENEYLINKQKVRLKDVLLLLAQARIGHDSYTVVGQGLIDTALSLRAEERRGLFEDAAGIRPFQVQRADAENRLKQTEANLERLRDITNEIKPRLGPLAEQARRAVEHKQASSELQSVLMTWYALQWRRLRSNRERAELAEQEQARNVRQIELALQALDEQGQTLLTNRQQTQARIMDARKVYSEANNAAQKVERDLAVHEERVGGMERQRVDIQQEEHRLRERLIALQKQAIDLKEQCELADESIDTAAASLASLETQTAKAHKEYELDERRLRTAQADLIQVQARLGSSQTELGRVQKQLGERNRTLASRRETIAHAQQTQRTTAERLSEERSRLTLLHNEEQQLQQRKQEITRTIADAQQEMERLKATLTESERQRRGIADRLNMLKNWRQSLSGYSDGVRTLLRAPAGKLSGLLGPIPQLGTAEAGTELALEAALGPYMQAVVVQTLNDAHRCLDYLQNAHAGKAMVVWLEREGTEPTSEGEGYTLQTESEQQGLQRFLDTESSLKERVVGFAWHHIHCESPYLALFYRILHGIVIVRDVHTALELLAWILPLSLSSVGDLPFEAVVTLKGELFHVQGWLLGGSGSAGGKDNNQQGLLAYERELRELPHQLEHHISLIEQVNGMFSEAQRAHELRRAEQMAIEKELYKVGGRINELNKVVATSQREQERLQTEIRLAASVEQQLAAEVAGLEQEVTAAQERVRNHEKSQREMTGRVEELQYEMEERAIVHRRQQDELGRARTALAVKRQEAKALHQQLTFQQTQALDLKAQVEQQVTRGKEIEQQLQQLQQTIAQHRSMLEQAQERTRTLASTLRKVEGQLVEIDQQSTAVERQRIQTQQQKAEHEGSYRRTLLESQKTRDAVEALLAQLQEELGVADPGELAVYAAQDDATQGQNGQQNSGNGHIPLLQGGTEVGELTEDEEIRLRRLRRKVDALRSRLKAMGGYDADAPQRYEEERTRFEFLSTQTADMEQAAFHLRSIIGQLDVTMARQFEITFQTVNARFREHFTTLFNGGSARLELINARSDDDSPAPSSMPTGIEVIVQPPGKKVQDLSLLSGGERALVSAALLFALLEMNPPPFCLLDEVDAALDESNVVRFCDILKRLAQRTQCIVITHNRVTMTSAQALYGVSMRDSVSRLLSIKLEAAVAGDR